MIPSAPSFAVIRLAAVWRTSSRFVEKVIPHFVGRRKVAKHRRNHGSHHLLLDRLRQIGMDIRELRRIQTIAHRHSQSYRQPLARLHPQYPGVILLRILHHRCGEHAVADVIRLQSLDQRQHQMHARIHRPLPCADELIHPHSRRAAGHNSDAHCAQKLAPPKKSRAFLPPPSEPRTPGNRTDPPHAPFAISGSGTDPRVGFRPLLSAGRSP